MKSVYLKSKVIFLKFFCL